MIPVQNHPPEAVQAAVMHRFGKTRALPAHLYLKLNQQKDYMKIRNIILTILPVMALLLNPNVTADSKPRQPVPEKVFSLGNSDTVPAPKENPSNPLSLAIARFIQQLLQPNVFTARELIDKIRTAPREQRPELLLALGRFIVLQEGKTGTKIILGDISDYFDREMEARGLSADSFEDLEKYFIRYVSADEFFPAIFLYYKSKFDVSDRNTIVKNARSVFDDKQGECDDVSMFINYFALKKKIRGVILGEKITDLYRYYGSTEFHAQFYYKDSEKIYVLDNNAILRFRSDEFGNHFDYLRAYNRSFEQGAAVPYDRFKNGNREEREFCYYVMKRGVAL